MVLSWEEKMRALGCLCDLVQRAYIQAWDEEHEVLIVPQFEREYVLRM